MMSMRVIWSWDKNDLELFEWVLGLVGLGLVETLS